MALPLASSDTWRTGMDVPRRLFDWSDDTCELHEEDGEYVLTIELPGFEKEEISVTWDDGMLNVAAEHEDEDRGRSRTYHRRFRLPQPIDADGIEAAYTNGVLEVRLPAEATGLGGMEIDIDG